LDRGWLDSETERQVWLPAGIGDGPNALIWLADSVVLEGLIEPDHVGVLSAET